ncbi:MAG: hypothetical protein JF616_11350 [Fibrobacteres bacterium]|nr:hypothetical protein [Fibrobacterota bacterium]
MRPILTILLISAALGRAFAAHLDGGPGPTSFGPPGDPTSGMRSEDVTDRLNRDWQQLQETENKYGLATMPEAAPTISLAQSLIAQARQSLSAGNVSLAFNQCLMLENHITELDMLGSRKSMDRFRSGDIGGIDTSRQRQDQQNAAEYSIQRVTDRLAYLSQRLESGKNPAAATLINKVKALLDAARSEAAAGRTLNVFPLLAQADPLLNELQRLQQDLSEADSHGASGPSGDPDKNQQQAPMTQATANYQRVYNAAQRLGERPVDGENAKTTALRTRVFDLLEKAKDALATGQPEAAKGYCLKAESLLTEWHRSLASDDKLSPAARDRVKAKLDLAGDIVASAGDEKASRILEKARDHFDRAERSRIDGRAGLAAVEMDLALKLAAKAVDIARARSR